MSEKSDLIHDFVLLLASIAEHGNWGDLKSVLPDYDHIYLASEEKLSLNPFEVRVIFFHQHAPVSQVLELLFSLLLF